MSRPRSYRVCKAPITRDLIAGRRGHEDGWDSRPPAGPRPSTRDQTTPPKDQRSRKDS